MRLSIDLISLLGEHVFSRSPSRMVLVETLPVVGLRRMEQGGLVCLSRHSYRHMLRIGSS